MGSLSRNTRSRPFFKELTDKFDGATSFYPRASGGLLDSAGWRTFFPAIIGVALAILMGARALGISPPSGRSHRNHYKSART